MSLTAPAEYQAGYEACMRDLSGPRTFERWALMERDIGRAAYLSQGGPEWVDREIERLSITQSHEPSRPKRTGVVYLAEDGIGRLKIGYTGGPVQRRMKQLGDGSGLSIRCVAQFAGTRKEEALVHEVFLDQRIKGEWFHDCAAIRELFEDMG